VQEAAASLKRMIPGVRQTFNSSIVAYCLGAIGGVAALLFEIVAYGQIIRPEAAAAYAMAGGLLAACVRFLLGLRFPAHGSRTGALVASSSFALLQLLYFANVKLLPGEPYLSKKSLAADVSILALVLAIDLALARSVRIEEMRTRSYRVWTVVGAGLLLVSTAVLVWRWPEEPEVADRNGSGPNLVLVVFDSGRRDHMSLYGYGRATSPSLAAAAEEGRIYETAYAGSSWTVPSVSELLWWRLEPSLPGPEGLAARLRARGYVTACFSDNPHLDTDSRLLTEFDAVHRSVGPWRALIRGTTAGAFVERLSPGTDRALVDRALAWAGRRKGPFFLYVHLMDCHAPYRWPAIDGRRRSGRRIEFPYRGLQMTRDEEDDVVARYDGGILSSDTAAGRVLAGARGWGRPFVGIVTADHGESLGEEGRWFHGGSLAPELLSVPLVVVGDSVKRGRPLSPVGYSSVGKTLLAAAGIPCEECPGVDLRDSDGDGVAEGGLPPNLRFRIVGDHKIVLDRQSKRAYLFDLRDDPRELHDRASDSPDILRSLMEGMHPDVPSVPAPLQQAVR
jgi:hypothetical protein